MEQKILITMAFNDGFIDGGLAMVYSLKKNFKDIDKHDFKIYYSPSFCPLSEENQGKLKAIHDKIEFVDGSHERYMRWEIVGDDSFSASFLTLESFKEDGYDKVVYYDADMLCISDPSEDILNAPLDKVSGCGSSNTGINCGFIVIGKKYLGIDVWDNLMSHGPNKVRLLEQQIINSYFPKPGAFHILPYEHNWTLQRFDYKLSSENIKSIQWSGGSFIIGSGKKFLVKPWEDYCNFDESKYFSMKDIEANKIWWEYNNEMREKYSFEKISPTFRR